MLKIEKDSDGCDTTLRLSGRIDSDRISCIRNAMKGSCVPTTIDLGEVTLVDVDAVRFLMECEKEGIELAQCPLWVHEWIDLERAEETSPDGDSGYNSA
jgi:hypothetical protein